MHTTSIYKSLHISLICALLFASSLFADPYAARSAAEYESYIRVQNQSVFHGRRASSTLDETLIEENFNGRIFPPSGWNVGTMNTSDPTYTWFAQDYLSPQNPHEGYYNAGVLWDTSGAPQDEWLYSPVFSLGEAPPEPDSGQAAIRWNLTFQWMMSYFWGVEPNDNYDLELWLSMDGGGSYNTLLWTEDSVSTFNNPNQNFEWFDETIDLVPYAEHSSLRLGWRYTGHNGAEAGIDAVSLSVPTDVISFPDTSTVEWYIDIASHLNIEDVDIALNVTHDYISDVTFSLDHQSQLSVLLVQGAPNDFPVGNDFVGTVFDDQATREFVYAEGSSPYTGRWRPAEPLSTFNNSDAFGRWTLTATDESLEPATVGSINDVILYINEFPDFDADTFFVESTINRALTDINVTLEVTHPMISEMYFILVSPQGTSVQLVPKEESINYTGADFIGTVFDDEAENSYAFDFDTNGYTGSWIPYEHLSAFDGEAPNGTWQLIGIDFVPNDNSGTIDTVILDIDTSPQANDGNESAFPASFRFNGNYPNPFNPSTTLSFELPVSAHVSLNIYNTLGRHVKELLNERISTGIHSVQFDGVNLASGIYFAVLETDGFQATHKMMLLK